MRKGLIRYWLLFVSCCFLFVVALEQKVSAGFADEYQFDTPVNLGPDINSPYSEFDPKLTSDGNTLIFVSTRPGGYGSYDIYISHRINGEWQPAQNIGPSINSSASETDPAISPDGNLLFFASSKGKPNTAYSRVWVSEKINDVWQPATLLPANVNFSWANNNPQFVSPDGKWLYTSHWVGSRFWDIYRYDITTGNYTIRELLPAPINSNRRDFAITHTIDSKYFLFYSDRAGWHSYATENIDGTYQTAELLPFPFTVHSSLAENDTLLYLQISNASDGYGSDDIYYAPRFMPCDSFSIINLTGDNAIISPLPLTGQAVHLTAAINGNFGSPVEWTISVGGKVVDEGSGIAVEASWDGRNAEGEIVTGTYELVLTANTIDGACSDEKSIPATIDWEDDCKLKVTFDSSSNP